ncbi:MAG: hypothetical protein ACX932_01915 [Gammaproteobacteria bacterium]
MGILCLLFPVTATWYYGQRHLYHSAQSTANDCRRWNERINHYIHEQKAYPQTWLDLIKRGYLPRAFVSSSSGEVMSNPWGKSVTFSFLGNDDAHKDLQFHFSGVHKNQCMWLKAAFKHEKATVHCEEGDLRVIYHHSDAMLTD